MKKTIISIFCLVNFLTGITQNPTPKEIMKNKISKMIVYSENNFFDDLKSDTTTYFFDNYGNVITKNEGILGVFKTRYTYNKEGLPVQCIELNGNKYEIDSINYAYNPDGSYNKYTYSSNEYMGMAGGTINQKFYNTKGLLTRELNPLPPIKDKSDTIFSSWSYDVRGNNISFTKFSTATLTPQKIKYTIKYDANGRMIERTWPSKYSVTTPVKETFKYNKLGLISEYYKDQPEKEKHYFLKMIYVYQ